MSRPRRQARAAPGRWAPVALGRLALVAAMLACGPALAADGVLEIGQACAVGTGCFVGDTPGFPVTVTAPGSYQLTSDLVVGDPALDAIQVQVDGVSIDLAGFGLVGPVVCTGTGTGLGCAPLGSGRGIDAENRMRITIRDGSVQGFGVEGVIAGRGARIRNVVARGNRSDGISTGIASIVSDSLADRNGGQGVRCGRASLVVRTVARGNFFSGMSLAQAVAAIGNGAFENGVAGISAGGGSLVRDSASHRNEGSGVSVSQGSLVSDVVSYDNDGSGIHVQAGDSVQRSTVRLNGSPTGYGIEFSPALQLGAYRENTISANGTGSVSAGGLDMGANSCDGTPTCP